MWKRILYEKRRGLAFAEYDMGHVCVCTCIEMKHIKNEISTLCELYYNFI